MNFSVMGSLNTQVKTMEMKTRWYLKKESKDYTAKCKSIDEWISSTQASMQEKMFGSDYEEEKLNKIRMKLDMGEELTPREKAYLKEKDPERYKELIKEEAEQKAYEEKLKKCKTKEEVDSLQFNRISSTLSKVNAVKNNPNIPLSAKLDIIMKEKRKLDAAMESTRKFIASGKYDKLPSEKEENKEKNDNVIKDEHTENNIDIENTNSNEISNEINKQENNYSEETEHTEIKSQETSEINTEIKFSNTGYYKQFDFSKMEYKNTFNKKA